MSQKCSKAIKAFQRLLVYEPVKEPCNVCERPRPYPSAPPFGTSIKVCSFKEMERMCFPKLCDCPCKEIPLCPDAQRRHNICMAIYWLATFALFAFLFDSGIFRHPVFTARITDDIWVRISELFEKENAPKKETDLKWEYEKATKVYNITNFWNAMVVSFGDLLIAAIKLPGFVIVKTMEKFNEEGTIEGGDKTKDLSHDKKGAKTEDKKKEQPKQQKMEEKRGGMEATRTRETKKGSSEEVEEIVSVEEGWAVETEEEEMVSETGKKLRGTSASKGR